MNGRLKTSVYGTIFVTDIQNLCGFPGDYNKRPR